MFTRQLALTTVALALWCAVTSPAWQGALPLWALVAITGLAGLTALRRLHGTARALRAP